MTHLKKIVSGGQTGVDRAALDAAFAAGFPCGGWCPSDRGAEDGIIPSRYPLTPLAKGGYPERTRQNVKDSDGTLIVTFGPPTGGTALTHRCCLRLRKPHIVIDADELDTNAAIDRVLRFIKDQHIETLNVAGPRQSGNGRAYPFTLELIGALLKPSPSR